MSPQRCVHLCGQCEPGDYLDSQLGRRLVVLSKTLQAPGLSDPTEPDLPEKVGVCGEMLSCLLGG